MRIIDIFCCFLQQQSTFVRSYYSKLRCCLLSLNVIETRVCFASNILLLILSLVRRVFRIIFCRVYITYSMQWWLKWFVIGILAAWIGYYRHWTSKVGFGKKAMFFILLLNSNLNKKTSSYTMSLIYKMYLGCSNSYGRFISH
jgi:hypothetical protein